MAEEFLIKTMLRVRGSSMKTDVNKWIQFLTEGDRYNKTIRTKEEAAATGKPIVIYPELTDVHRFNAFRKDTDTVFKLEYKDEGLLELNQTGNEFNPFQSIFISELKTALGLQAGGGKRRSRRRSRKAKKNKAHTPQ